MSKASVSGVVLSAAGKFPVVTEDDMLRKIINESSSSPTGRRTDCWTATPPEPSIRISPTEAITRTGSSSATPSPTGRRDDAGQRLQRQRLYEPLQRRRFPELECAWPAPLILVHSRSPTLVAPFPDVVGTRRLRLSLVRPASRKIRVVLIIGSYYNNYT